MFIGKPIPFILVLVIASALTIFLGAWAVSTDLEVQNSVFSTALGTSAGGASDSIKVSPEGKDYLADSLTADVVDLEQKWWQSAILTACPLH
mgnify:FL=1